MHKTDSHEQSITLLEQTICAKSALCTVYQDSQQTPVSCRTRCSCTSPLPYTAHCVTMRDAWSYDARYKDAKCNYPGRSISFNLKIPNYCMAFSRRKYWQKKYSENPTLFTKCNARQNSTLFIEEQARMNHWKGFNRRASHHDRT